MAFAKQQGEIAALNRAQEKAEARVSSIHHQLTASESELSVLEGEMAEVRALVVSFPPHLTTTANSKVKYRQLRRNGRDMLHVSTASMALVYESWMCE